MENNDLSTMMSSASNVSASTGYTVGSASEPPTKKKCNLPGMPDPNADVISLSPQSLMATNRFICEVCRKGFQRDQNLQLHRRGHNLPWKLRQRCSKDEVRRKVYVCPETSCVHHHPSRELGDLTGIKKHYSRKHGEKKWKCQRCSKNYAVQSDCKAHMKTCGTREYKCDCGTLFSRRDSFISHRAFCDVLAEEKTKVQTQAAAVTADDTQEFSPTEEMVVASSPPPPSPITPVATVISPMLSIHSPDLPDNSTAVTDQTLGNTLVTTTAACNSSCSSSYFSGKSSVLASIFAPSTAAPSTSFSHFMPPASQSTHLHPSSSPKADTGFSHSLTSPSVYFTGNSFSLFPTIPDLFPDHHQYAPVSHQPTMSATALLQKAAQMTATASGSSLLCGFSLSMPSSSSTHECISACAPSINQWSSQVKADPGLVNAGLCLGLGFPSSNMYGQPITLDLLGLRLGTESSSSGQLSTYLNSMEGTPDGAPANSSFRIETSHSQNWEGDDRRL